jgi:hypothetical protein
MVNGVTSHIYIYPLGAADHGAEGVNVKFAMYPFSSSSFEIRQVYFFQTVTVINIITLKLALLAITIINIITL